MEGYRIPHSGPLGEYPGDRDDIQQLSRNASIPPYPQYPVAPQALGGMAPAPVNSGEYPMSNDGRLAGLNRSTPLGSHYNIFLDHHRNLGMASGQVPEFNRAAPSPFQCYGDFLGSVQSVPPGLYVNQDLSLSGTNQPGTDPNEYPNFNSSSFTPNMYNTGHYPYHGTPGFGEHGLANPDGNGPTNSESRRYPDFDSCGPPSSHINGPTYANYMALSGPNDRGAPILMSPFHSMGSPGVGKRSSPDDDGAQPGFRSHGNLSSDSQGCEIHESVVSDRSGPAPHPGLGHDQVALNPASSPRDLQSQATPHPHRQETTVQQLASAIRMGVDFKTYQKLYGKPIGDFELKENKVPSLSSSGPAVNHTPCAGEPPEDIGKGTTAVISPHKSGVDGRMAARGLGGDLEDIENQLGSLTVGQEVGGAASIPKEANETRQTQPRSHLRNASVNMQKGSLDSQSGIEVHGNNVEDRPLETLKPATSSGPNPTTPVRRRPNQAQRRQSKLHPELLGAASPATIMVPQTPRQYSRGRKGTRQPPLTPPSSSVPQGQPRHKPGPTHHVGHQIHPQAPNNREQQQALLQTQHAYFSRAETAHQVQSFQRKLPDSRYLCQLNTSAQTGPRQQQQPPQHQKGPVRFPIDLEETIKIQSDYLSEVAKVEVAKAEISSQEVAEKEVFRSELEATCRDVISRQEASIPGGGIFDPNTIRLECFGSLSSGFATKSSDMDLVLLSPLSRPPLSSSDSPIPRLLEKRLLELGLGARFLTKTRVPIMKLCEKPTAELLDRLKMARGKWEAGEDNVAMSEKDTDSTLEFSPSRDMGRIQQMKLNDSEDPTTPAGHGNPDSRGSSEPRSPTHSLRHLEQKTTESLWAYNSRARKLLKLGGGRDITLRHENLQPAELELLTAAAEGYVNGIRDEIVRDAAKAALPKNSTTSLYGVWLLAEGEQLIKGWETRKIHELTGEKEAQGYKLIREWRQLQNREGMVPAHYNEAQRKLLEQMQRLPSLRLLSLVQRPDEPTEMYSIRANAILEELGGIDCEPGNWEDELSPTQRTLLELTIRQYVEGIYDPTLRKAVRRTSSHRNVSFADVSSIHHAELSTRKYESGISMGLYTDEEQEILREYTQLVRLYGLKSGRDDVRTILEKIKSIPDPSPPSKQRDFVDTLEFPKTGVGIQCDINFSNLLALYNTALLRCYSHSDPRVRPMTIFVKAWAKKRKINSPYHGTLSSYGYVLMVLHFLLNVASPPVLTNLQHAWEFSEREFLLDGGLCEGYNIKFWCDEEEIKRLASLGQFSRNKQSLGALLRGFFEYYSHQGAHVIKNGFVWNLNTISIRTSGGLLPKQVKGWTEAKTVVVGGKEVRQRYLLAIEDPFETDHNVGRTVTYHGILSIRDELRRAWRIINAVGRDSKFQESLFDEAAEVKGRVEKPVKAGA